MSSSLPVEEIQLASVSQPPVEDMMVPTTSQFVSSPAEGRELSSECQFVSSLMSEKMDAVPNKSDFVSLKIIPCPKSFNALPLHKKVTKVKFSPVRPLRIVVIPVLGNIFRLHSLDN